VKRFWTETEAVERPGGWGIMLDGRPLKTPARAELILLNAALAEAVRAEWAAAGDTIDPRAMPLTGLANAAIERVAAEPTRFAANLASYGESDLLCYRAESPDELVARQAAVWDPPLDWARARYDVHFTVTSGVMHRAQPAATIARLGEAVNALDAFALAALAPVVTITGSLVLGLALIEQAMTADALWAAAHVDETWQAECWGEDALATQALAVKRAEFDAAVRFLGVL
jgi:chaperone required for assembly of F1-ATPase